MLVTRSGWSFPPVRLVPLPPCKSTARADRPRSVFPSRMSPFRKIGCKSWNCRRAQPWLGPTQRGTGGLRRARLCLASRCGCPWRPPGSKFRAAPASSLCRTCRRQRSFASRRHRCQPHQRPTAGSRDWEMMWSDAQLCARGRCPTGPGVTCTRTASAR